MKDQFIPLLNSFRHNVDFRNIITLCSFEIDGELKDLPAFRECLATMVPVMSSMVIVRSTNAERSDHPNAMTVTLKSFNSVSVTFLIPDHVFVDMAILIERILRNIYAGNRLRRPDGDTVNYNDAMMASVSQSCSEDDIEYDFGDYLICAAELKICVDAMGVTLFAKDSRDEEVSASIIDGLRIYEQRISITSLEPVENPLRYSPFTGKLFDSDKRTADNMRRHNNPWTFNPWNGEPRFLADIQDDPQGFKITPL